MTTDEGAQFTPLKEDDALHLFTYRFNGQEYGFELRAKDKDEALARLRALAWAKYDGELVAKITIPAGFWANVAQMAVFIRTIFR